MRIFSLVLSLVLSIPALADNDAEVEICRQHRLVVSNSKQLSMMKKKMKKKDPLLQSIEDGMKQHDDELKALLARYKTDNGKEFDVKTCKNEENLANLEKLSKGTPSKNDAEILQQHQQIVSEPEALQDACVLKMQIDNSKNLLGALPPAQQKELKGAQEKLAQMLKQKEAAFSKRHGKAIDYGKCPH